MMLFQHKIKATRESVCMGDDCNAPNARELDYKPDQLFSEWLSVVADYVPTMHNVVWSVHAKSDLLAYLIFDHKGNFTIELIIPDQNMSMLGINEVYCRYYYQGELVNRYSDLMDKGKK